MRINTTEQFDAGNCLWNDTAISGEQYPELQEDIACDVLVAFFVCK